jgi:hypothetical protein
MSNKTQPKMEKNLQLYMKPSLSTNEWTLSFPFQLFSLSALLFQQINGNKDSGCLGFIFPEMISPSDDIEHGKTLTVNEYN